MCLVRMQLANGEQAGNNTLAAVIAERLNIPHANPAYVENTFDLRFPRVRKRLEAYDKAKPKHRLANLRSFIAEVDLCTPDADDLDRLKLIAYALQPDHKGNSFAEVEERYMAGSPHVLLINGRPVEVVSLTLNHDRHTVEGWPSPYASLPSRTPS